MFSNSLQVSRLQKLNATEHRAISDALEEYIARHPGKHSWNQKIILEDMLDKLFWASEPRDAAPEGK